MKISLQRRQRQITKSHNNYYCNAHCSVLEKSFKPVHSVADINHLLELIVVFTTKESNLQINGGWILLNVLKESHIYSSIFSYANFSDFVTSLQHILHTWVVIQLGQVLNQFQLRIQDIFLKETEFLELVISISDLLVLFKGSRGIFFEDLESWLRNFLSIFKNLRHSKSPISFWVRTKVDIKWNKMSSSFRLRNGKYGRSTRVKRRDFRERERERERFYHFHLTKRN